MSVQPILPIIPGVHPTSSSANNVFNPTLWTSNRTYHQPNVFLENQARPYKEVPLTETMVLDNSFSSFVDLFLIQSFVGHQTLINFFYAREHMGSVEAIELLETFYANWDDVHKYQAEDMLPANKHLVESVIKRLPKEMVQSESSLYRIIESLIASCSKTIESNKIRQLFNFDPHEGAEGEAAEFLEMFTELRKRPYPVILDEILALPAAVMKLFNVPHALMTKPLYHKEGWELVPQNHHLNYLIQTSLVDMLLYQWLLHDDLPIGFLTFYFMMDHKKSEKNTLRFKTCVCQNNQTVKSIDVTFDTKLKKCILKENNKTIGILKVEFSKKNHVEIRGSFLNQPFKLSFNADRKHAFNEHVQLTDWKGSYLGSRGVVKEFGWRSHKTGEQKKLRSRYGVYRNRYNDLLTHQDGCIGEDKFSVSTWFHQYLFIPMAATGVIFNEKEHRYTI